MISQRTFSSLSQTELERISRAAELEKWLNKVCDIYRVTNTSDGAGGYTKTSVLYLTTKCRLKRPSNSSIVKLADSLKGKAEFECILPATSNITISDKLSIDTLSGDGNSSPVSYSIIAPPMTNEISTILIISKVV